MRVMTSPVELAKPRALEIGALSWLAQDGTFARLPAGMFSHHDGAAPTFESWLLLSAPPPQAAMYF